MQHRMTETKLSDGRRAFSTLSYNGLGSKGKLRIRPLLEEKDSLLSPRGCEVVPVPNQKGN